MTAITPDTFEIGWRNDRYNTTRSESSEQNFGKSEFQGVWCNSGHSVNIKFLSLWCYSGKNVSVIKPRNVSVIVTLPCKTIHIFLENFGFTKLISISKIEEKLLYMGLNSYINYSFGCILPGRERRSTIVTHSDSLEDCIVR